MDLYPPLLVNQAGYLGVGDGHNLYWEESGNRQGIPILFVHGGPGAGTDPAYRRFFDPAVWRIILLDQRGCGQSTPLGCLINNTTQALVEDFEQLRLHLGVERWVLFGGSWGSTLALAYGQVHPQQVLGFVLRGVFLFRPSEVDWFLYGMGLFYPDARRHFQSLVADEPMGVLEAYYRRLTDPDPAVHLPAAHYWSEYEDHCARLIPRPVRQGQDDGVCLALARLECHYMVHGGFLDEQPLLAGMGRIAHLPCIIVQGRHDVICPPVSADDLAAHWPGAELRMVEDGAHSALEEPMRRALVGAVRSMHDWLVSHVLL